MSDESANDGVVAASVLSTASGATPGSNATCAKRLSHATKACLAASCDWLHMGSKMELR